MHSDWYPHTGINWIDKASGGNKIKSRQIAQRQDDEMVKGQSTALQLRADSE